MKRILGSTVQSPIKMESSMSPGAFKAFLSPTHQAAAQFGGHRSNGTFQKVISLFKKCLLLYYTSPWLYLYVTGCSDKVI
jgi:hypothetical protein